MFKICYNKFNKLNLSFTKNKKGGKIKNGKNIIK